MKNIFRSQNSRTFGILILFSVFISISFVSKAFAGTLEEEIKGRHFELSGEALVGPYGSEDEVVADLISLRNVDMPPYVSTRAVKSLLSFSNREDVRSVLRGDVVDASSLGLCSVILANLSMIPDQAFRIELSQLALSSIDTKNKKVLPSRINRIKSILNNSSDQSVKALVNK